MELLFFIIIGAAIGWLLTIAVEMKTDAPVAIAVGALGGLVGGLVLWIVLPVMAFLFGIVGAVVGAVALIWLVTLAAQA